MSFIATDFNQQNQRYTFYDYCNMNFNESAMSRNSMEDRNAIMTSTTTTTRYASDLPSFHPPNYSEWPIQKMSPPSFLMQTHPYPSTSFPGYPTYPTAPPHTAATVSTPSYCSTFSEASHSSPTLFWAHPNPPETDHTHLLTEVATPTTTATTTTTTTQPNNNSQEISPEPSNKVSLTSELFSPIITRDLPNPYSPVISQKVHPRYKTTNTCTLAYDQRSRQKHSQHFLSPPLHPIDSSSQLLTAPSPDLCKSSFQFQAILHSPTATMKSEHQKPITYLNRGQTYLLELNSNNPERGTLTSTLSIAFHEHDHRKVASGYWKFWLSQQLEPQKARAIDLDEHQTTGIYNIRYDTFDKITFDWHGRLGAKIYVRFHCLSTDFSRIKGVKGIPMRANIETRTRYAQLPEHSHDYSGHFVQKENDTHFIHHQPNYYEYVEKSFCQMKLFRDKGAERKNKDDAKQIHKQLQKATALTMNNAQQHPSWSILNQPYKPVTLLNQIPQSPEEELLMDPLDPESNYPPELIDALHVPLQETGKKRKRVMVNTTTLTTTANEPNEFALFEPNTTATLNKRWPSPSHGLEFFLCSKHSFPTLQERITLETLTKEHLRLKLATALSLYPQRVTEVLWKKKKKTVDDETFMLVDDPLIAENIVQGETVWIECEMKPDSSVRLVLEFNSRFNNP